MPGRRDQITEIRDWRGGLNLAASRTDLTNNESVTMRDVVVQLDGSVRARPGVLPIAQFPRLQGTPLGDNFVVHSVNRQQAPNETRTASPPRDTIVAAVRNATGGHIGIHLTPFSPADYSIGTDGTLRLSDSVVARVLFLPSDPSWYPVTMASVAGNLYVARPDQVVERWSWDSAGALTSTALGDPTDTARTYFDELLYDNEGNSTGNPDIGTQLTQATDSSWSEGPDLFSDIYDPIGADTPLNRRRPRFPNARIIRAIDLQSTIVMFAATGTTLRWSWPLQWQDSGYYGIGQGDDGDPGPDWDPGFPQHASEPDAQVRLFGPEDWRRNDFTEISAGEGDEITAIAQFQDQIIIFTRHSTTGLYGELGQWRLLPHSRSVGCVGPKAFVETGDGIYFYSHPEGLMLWDGKEVRAVSDKLGSFSGRFIDTAEVLDQVAVGYNDKKILVAVPWAVGQTTQGDNTFAVMVLDLRHGAWTQWSMDVSAFASFKASQTTAQLLALTTGNEAAYAGTQNLDDNIGASVVSLNDVPTNDTITDYYQGTPTAPTDARNPIAELVVGPVRAEVPDQETRWRYLVVEADTADGGDSGQLELRPMYGGSDDPDVETYSFTDRMKHFLTLGAKSDIVSLSIRWTNPAVEVSGVSFVYWNTRRGQSVS